MPFDKHSPDHIDLVIMTELKKYPPSTMRYIGKIAGRSHVVIHTRYKWLETEGYICMAPEAVRSSARSMILTQKGFEYLANVGNL